MTKRDETMIPPNAPLWVREAEMTPQEKIVTWVSDPRLKASNDGSYEPTHTIFIEVMPGFDGCPETARDLVRNVAAILYGEE